MITFSSSNSVISVDPFFAAKCKGVLCWLVLEEVLAPLDTKEEEDGDWKQPYMRGGP